jgi:hypothetical protein
MVLIEIDGLPEFTVLKNGWIFHGNLLNNQMVILSPFAKHGLVGDLHTFGNHQWGLVLDGWDFSQPAVATIPPSILAVALSALGLLLQPFLFVMAIFVFFVDNCHYYYGYYNITLTSYS